jgi:hypothetical protein
MREMLFVLVLVVAVSYWITHPNQVESSLDGLVGQMRLIADWLKGLAHR